MDKYAVINSKKEVVNIISWDGISEWSPPEGQQAINVGVDYFVDLDYVYDEDKNEFFAP
ncbi:hypothetical protein [Serratia fonticola]|uniref:hypothetical protein n=1 Tax=Serratia fonticola TaxID=47917 RepID=UPI000B0612F7|nr:hypothetical protein [Serratia fonticola]